MSRVPRPVVDQQRWIKVVVSVIGRVPEVHVRFFLLDIDQVVLYLAVVGGTPGTDRPAD